MKEAGENEDTIFASALASGAAEVIFEYVSLDKLLKIKNVDSITTVVVDTTILKDSVENE